MNKELSNSSARSAYFSHWKKQFNQFTPRQLEAKQNKADQEKKKPQYWTPLCSVSNSGKIITEPYSVTLLIFVSPGITLWQCLTNEGLSQLSSRIIAPTSPVCLTAVAAAVMLDVLPDCCGAVLCAPRLQSYDWSHKIQHCAVGQAPAPSAHWEITHMLMSSILCSLTSAFLLGLDSK